jgi:hypothetical protein
MKRDISKKENGTNYIFAIFMLGVGIIGIGMVAGAWKWFREIFDKMTNF